ncbi:peptide chain release factor N(5)-glutamine methyltransferase [Myceligenerans cantabricum]
MSVPHVPGPPPADTDGLVRQAAQVLSDAGVGSPRVDAELLLAHALGVGPAEVRRRAILGTPVSDDERARLAGLVARRAAREPLQHLTGVAAFRYLELAVGPGVFVPRPETEQVAQVAVDEAARLARAVVVDLCTGSGAIALAVATEVPGSRVHAVELDAGAHAWAARNIAAAPVRAAAPGGGYADPVDAAGRAEALVHLVKGDARTALRELDGAVDVVVSNPPYVPPDAVPRDPEVAEHDPAVALYGLGADGLEVPRGIAAAAARLLRPGGLFVMEHAEVQASEARAMVDAVPEPGAARRATPGPSGPEPTEPTGPRTPAPAAVGPAFGRAATRDDLAGRPRMVVARRADRRGRARES